LTHNATVDFQKIQAKTSKSARELFLADDSRRTAAKIKNPSYNYSQITSFLRSEWNNLSEEEQKAYAAQATKEKERVTQENKRHTLFKYMKGVTWTVEEKGSWIPIDKKVSAFLEMEYPLLSYICWSSAYEKGTEKELKVLGLKTTKYSSQRKVHTQTIVSWEQK
jgi:hypothetical protein